MDTPAVYESIFSVFAFVLGAAIGSFLNVCIYRLPRDLSVNQPRRSFCPSCKKPIPWQQNLPLLSWLLLRGKCANCGSRIAFRYFAVELLTALLFLAVWLAFPWPIALVYWVFVSLLVAATFIDFEHFIIPDEITIGGTVAGVLASLALPALMGEDSRWRALAQSLGAAALGYALLWIVLEAGKKAFGKKRIRLEAATPFSWVRDGDDAEFVVGEERGLWSDHFARESDLMLLRCSEAQVDARHFENPTLQLHYNRLEHWGGIISARPGRPDFRRRPRIANPAGSDGSRRSQVSRRDRRFSWLARRLVQHLCGFPRGLGRRPHQSVASADASGRPKFRSGLTSPSARSSGCFSARVWLPGT